MAVLGAGTMGAGIAVTVARAGYSVLLADVSQEKAEAGVRAADVFLSESVRRGKLDWPQWQAISARIQPCVETAAMRDAAIVIEAIPEDLDLKAHTLRTVEDVCADDVLFHTNTSTLPVTAIAGRMRRPGNVVGTHYCNPAPLMSLVEVAPARQTSAVALERTEDFLRSLGKEPIVLKDTPGLLTNFLLVPFENDCVRALEAGWGTVEEIDLAVTAGVGFPMGAFRLLDIVGLDVHRAVSLSLYRQLRDPRFAPPPLIERMVAAGELGRKAGRGFYRYGVGVSE
ncbi:3-hydroxyacyl-CoA dehydrogenase family protein [Nocardia sp. CA-129566]|uniref:3-hydroxyacyl-CoA dehydrogenase family protein n=1 Tax=Nocardia sp. CA-129566 TaxID=3239976 RepID=UPI003D979D8C